MNALLLAALLAVGQASGTASVTVPVDTTKATISIPVSSTFKDAAGVWWQVSGTLTAKPIPAPAVTGELPPPPPVPPTGSIGPVGPTITGYLDLDGKLLQSALPGQRFMVHGYGFGETGELWLNFNPVPTTAWLDTMIVSQVPDLITPNPNPGTITVMRPDTLCYTGLAFSIERTR